TMLIRAAPERIFESFVEPARLTQFWLSAASAPLEIGRSVEWRFMVPGAVTGTMATRLDRDRGISWRWSDGTSIDIDFKRTADGTAVAVSVRGFAGALDHQIESALNATEGFSIVLCDLKILLESGSSAGLVAAKARLIEAQTARTTLNPSVNGTCQPNYL